jgi:UDP-N-acetylglucosamine 2-epimerase (non-hydrolysing)
LAAKKVWLVFGTRPEAIKMAPVVHALREAKGVRPVVCVTAQHRELLDDVLSVFGIRPDFDLDLMRPGQTLHDLGGAALARLGGLFAREMPDFVLVQGDTTTCFAGALAAFYNHVPVGHVEAGLRSGRMDSPWPEEANRLLTTRVATLHFPPTTRSQAALRAEGVPARSIVRTGNTVIDALRMALARPLRGPRPWREPGKGKRLVLATVHRRESFGAPMEGVFRALRRLALRGDVEIVVPVHPNPTVRGAARRLLGGVPGVQLLPPLPYHAFVHLMSRAALILTDSGGVQEEAPTLGIPVLVLRDVTERPEAAEAGVAKVIGTKEERVVREARRLLDDPAAYRAMARRKNPFGDGQASQRIAKAVVRYLGTSST